MRKQSYRECLDKIYRLGRFGIKLELDTIQNILIRLNNPHKNYKIIHVAGTNGKGSTVAYIASVLKKAGFKTGVYTSPHLIRFNERICINGVECTNEQVVQAYEAVNDASASGTRNATFFEIATAMALYHFALEQIEWAVIETGMGGRLDATNIVNPELTVITNLSIEHTQYLGSTIVDLAREKGGIIKSETPVVTAVSQPSGLYVLSQIAKAKKANLYCYKKDFSVRKVPIKNQNQTFLNYRGIFQNFKKLIMPLPGDHQKENLSLGIAACELIFRKMIDQDSRYDFSQELISQALAETKWPGRLEIVCNAPLIILDGAHNLQAAKVLSKYLHSFLKERNLTLVIGILDDKPYEEMIKILAPCAKRMILTRPKIDRSLSTDILQKATKKFFKGKIEVIHDVSKAFSHALSSTSQNDAVCVAGSLYVIGEVKEKLALDFSDQIR